MRITLTSLVASSLVCAFAIGLSVRDAAATSMVNLSTEQLTDAADSIVKGTVGAVWTEIDDGGKCWTRARVEVEAVLKGAPGREVVVSQLGGICGPTGGWVESTARFSEGEVAYFFLEEMNDFTGVVGMSQGKFTLRMDPTVRHEIVMRYTLPADQPYDARFLPLPPADQRVAASDFERTVIQRVALGWDGEPIQGTSMARLRAINHLQPSVVK
jgi:hypothetical protein